MDFHSKRGLANHLRRGATNRCALLKASLINKEQNIPTLSDPKATKRNRGQRREGAKGPQGDPRGHSTSPINTKKRHRPPDYSEGPPWAEHPTPAVTSVLEMLNARPAPATRLAQQQPAETPPEAQLTHTQPDAACEQRNQPITRNRPLSIPRLPTAAYARLKNKLEDLAKATTARVSTGTWEEVEIAIEGFTAVIYDAVWFANKKPAAANQQSSRKPPSSNSIQQESRKARVPPRLAQAQDNVKKALLALREEEKAQQGRQQSPDPLDDKLRKRALERNLRTARRRLINALNEESAHNLQTLYTTDREKCVEQILADEDQQRRRDCPIQLSQLEAYFKIQHSEQCINHLSGCSRVPQPISCGSRRS